MQGSPHTNPVDYGIDRGPRSTLRDDVIGLAGAAVIIGGFRLGPRGIGALGRGVGRGMAALAKSTMAPSKRFVSKQAGKWATASLKKKAAIIGGAAIAGTAVAGAGTLMTGRRRPGPGNDPFDRRDKAKGLSPSNLSATGDLTLGLHYGK